MGGIRTERELSVDDGVIPSPVDPDYECVPTGGTAGESPVVPPPGGLEEPAGPRLCPEGYVPRRRRRTYPLQGKLIRPSPSPVRNPAADDEADESR